MHLEFELFLLPRGKRPQWRAARAHIKKIQLDPKLRVRALYGTTDSPEHWKALAEDLERFKRLWEMGDKLPGGPPWQGEPSSTDWPVGHFRSAEGTKVMMLVRSMSGSRDELKKAWAERYQMPDVRRLMGAGILDVAGFEKIPNSF